MRALILSVLLLSGCATMGSKEATVGCQVADVVSTAMVLATVTGAVELNPIVAGVIKGFGLPGLILVKGYLVWRLLKPDVSTDVRAFVSTVTCAAAVSNLLLLN